MSFYIEIILKVAFLSLPPLPFIFCQILFEVLDQRTYGKMIYWFKNHSYCLVNTKMIFSLGSMARVKRGRKPWRWWRSITSSYRTQRRRKDGHRRGSTTVAPPIPGKTSTRPCCSSKSMTYGKILHFIESDTLCQE